MSLPDAEGLCGLSIFLYVSMSSGRAMRLLISFFCLNVYMAVYEKGAGVRSAPGVEKSIALLSNVSEVFERLEEAFVGEGDVGRSILAILSAGKG